MLRDADAEVVRGSLLRGRCVVLVGPAGIGKTTLANRASKGLDVATGRCLLALAQRAYYPLSDARRRATAGPLEDVASDLSADLGGRSLRIEDVQWADAATQAVLARLVGFVPMLLTSRVEPAWADHETVDVVPVRPLTRREATSMAARWHPHLDDHEREQLVEFAGGNPLLLRYLAANDRVMPRLDDAVCDRLERLPASVVSAIRALAVHGRPARPATIGLGPSEGVGGLLRASGDVVWFVHDQFAKLTLEKTDDDLRRVLRLRLATRCDDVDAAAHWAALGEDERAVACARRAADEGEPATQADMLVLAVQVLGARTSLELRLEAADALLRGHRPAEARDVLEGVGGGPVEIAELGLRGVRALWMEGRSADALEQVDRLLAEVVEAPDELRARLAVERAHMLVRTRAGDPSIVEVANTALQLARAAGVETARAQSTLGLALSHSGHPGWDEHFRAAAETARAVGDVEEEVAANYGLVSALGFYGPMPDALRLGKQMLARSRTLGLRSWNAHYVAARAIHLCATGRVPDDDLHGCVRLLDYHPHFRNRAQVELVLTVSHLDRGDLGAAVDVVAAGRRFARNDEDRALLCCAELEIALAQLDVDLAVECLGRLAACRAGFFGLNALAESAALHVMLREPQRMEVPRYSNMLTPVLDVIRHERTAFDAWVAGQVDRAIVGFSGAADAWRSRHLYRFEVRALAAAAEVAVARR